MRGGRRSIVCLTTAPAANGKRAANGAALRAECSGMAQVTAPARSRRAPARLRAGELVEPRRRLAGAVARAAAARAARASRRGPRDRADGRARPRRPASPARRPRGRPPPAPRNGPAPPGRRSGAASARKGRDTEADQLVVGVVAGGRDREVEGAEVAAHRVGRLEVDDARRGPRGRPAIARLERRDLDARPAGAGGAAQRSTVAAHLPPWPSGTSDVCLGGIEAELARPPRRAAAARRRRGRRSGRRACARGGARPSGRDRRSARRTRRARGRVEERLAAERARVRAGPPHRPPAPDRHSAAPGR